ncbi:MAG: hypothetical protein M3Y25_08320 [Thermoproteota archaeon]|nr:hypothetical protein [Thermoproteota archaeon]
MQRLNDLKFDIAIPDSYLFGVKTDVDKTLKVFQLSRALSIFSVNNINIYHDKVLNPSNYERKFLSTILEYLDTPQYLRRKIYPRSDILNEVGRLHPIRSPHHKDKVDLKNLKSGDIRVGLVERKEGQFYVDVGLESLIKYEGKFRQSGKKINVKLIRQNKQVVGVDVKDGDLSNLFWGYSVHHFTDLKKIMERYDPTTIILTSRYSKYFDEAELSSIGRKSSDINNIMLVVFGSPKYGLDVIFDREGLDLKKYNSYNFFPKQGTQTVRLEEAIFGVLSILNFYIKRY